MKNDKGKKLYELAMNSINVAQFALIESDGCKVCTRETIIANCNIETAIDLLFKCADTVNIRTYKDRLTKGNPFIKDIKSKEDTISTVKNFVNNGYTCIVNESIDVSDNGVSGVVLNNVIEFTPDNTSRGVEEEGACSLSLDIGLGILETVYNNNFDVLRDLSASGDRLEFSIHPLKEGLNSENVIIWEKEEGYKMPSNKELRQLIPVRYPNNFSKLLGDKVFGLLVLDQLGFKVPYTKVINRRVGIFEFGTKTNTGEVWTRTAPTEKQAGLYTTVKGYIDPFKLLQEEDPNGVNIPSVLIQDSVDALASGSAIILTSGEMAIEGTLGKGDDFMVGEDEVFLPDNIKKIIRLKLQQFYNDYHRNLLGDISLEWAYDGTHLWLVQMNLLSNYKGILSKDVIVQENPHNPVEYINFNTKENTIEDLRILLEDIGDDKGITLIGNVGLTSHYGDLLRKKNIPSKIQRF